MASATPRSGKQSRQQPSKQQQGNPNGAPEIVDPIWLLRAAGVVVVAALICGYLSLCLLFYQGQWQLVLHPDRTKTAPASIAGAPFEIVHFGVDESGTPQLTGWWLPASPTARYADKTILYLPSGDGSLADAAPRLAVLHSLGINVFAFDYRGYGQSVDTHPNQHRMTQDTASAWQYLTISRGISGARIIPFGEGVGATLAAHLAAAQTQVTEVILQSPRTDLLKVVRDDPRTRMLPIHTLFHEDFEIAGTLSALRTAKLFLIPESSPELNIARGAADPKTIVAYPPSQSDGAAYAEQIARFLDQAH